ncbi:hypothetical protein P171DRAFT_139277 [Karstenula rhodostoma CBS 690.94]|uniref:Uncharacterized protein n=1 Tax=Karstenula rhodostoma CBS 690.94 TaxID=1392251 RepID=A0A9P4UH91_9PLEO|nr:hypothetical protein P171DRAFT_139277 [Karstenula rhodostoma CBS 690.94]
MDSPSELSSSSGFSPDLRTSYSRSRDLDPPRSLQHSPTHSHHLLCSNIPSLGEMPLPPGISASILAVRTNHPCSDPARHLISAALLAPPKTPVPYRDRCTAHHACISPEKANKQMRTAKSDPCSHDVSPLGDASAGLLRVRVAVVPSMPHASPCVA